MHRSLSRSMALAIGVSACLAMACVEQDSEVETLTPRDYSGLVGGQSKTDGTIILYKSNPVEYCPFIDWGYPGNEGPAANVPDWVRARYDALIEGPSILHDNGDPFDHAGAVTPQVVGATFNLEDGSGFVEIDSIDGRNRVVLEGSSGAFAVLPTAEVAASTPFSAESLANTPYAIMNTDPSKVTVSVWVDGERYEDTGIEGTQFGLFFPQDPSVGDIDAAAQPWFEKWCIVTSLVDDWSCGELQDY
ncbi:MAG: hypothetical protein K0V04_17935 [Deltaproteobacteria bacterium]|nr:hypothetical protein [Deltaproteobacteria bacterium]